MNKTIALCSMICWIAFWLIVTTVKPNILSDDNRFLREFVNQNFLSFMGVVVTITLASAGNLYIELNKLEDRADQSVFTRTKRDVRHSAFALIWALVAALVLVTIKPVVDADGHMMAFMNGLALTIILFSILVLIDLTKAAFNLDPRA